MNRLEERLRDELHNRADSIRTPVKEPNRIRVRARRRQGLKHLGLAAAIALLVGSVMLVDPFGTEQPSFVTEPPPEVTTTTSQLTTSTGPAPTTTSEAAVSFMTPDWQRISSAALGGDGDQWMETVALGGPGLVAAGAECPGSVCTLFGAEDGWDAAVWVSSDGVAWTRVPDEIGVFSGPGDQIIFDVVAAGPGLVAVGLEDPTNFGGMRPTDSYWNLAGIPSDEDDLDGAIWVSSDGLSWSRVVDDGAEFSGPGDQSIEAMAVGAGRIVAVGSAENTAAVWVSEDGLTWRRTPNVAEGVGGNPRVSMHDVIFTETGFVAVGTEEHEASPGLLKARGAVWISTDGLAWSRVENDPDTFGGTSGRADVAGDLVMWAIAESESGLVAAGYGWPSLLPLWISEDGLEWKRLGDSTPPFAWVTKSYGNGWTFSHMPVLALATAGDQLLAVGWDMDTAEVMWPGTRRFFAKDLAWLGNVMPGNAMNDVVVFEDVAIAVGIDGLGDIWGPSDAAVWMASISD